jgi:L-cystine uptake protein TcyP (sodium:dicarboxylate symporter family)
VADLARAKPTSIISVVIFAVFLGLAALQLIKDDAEKGERAVGHRHPASLGDAPGAGRDEADPLWRAGVDDQVVASSNLEDILKLGSFVVVSYLGLA